MLANAGGRHAARIVPIYNDGWFFSETEMN